MYHWHITCALNGRTPHFATKIMQARSLYSSLCRYLLARIPVFAGMVMIVASSASAGTLDIRSTKHNLSGNNNTEGKLDERQICVFCHTPTIEVGVKRQNNADVKPMGWQSSVPADHSFVIYDDIGRLGLGKESIGSQSMACMSCHDAVQAFAAQGDQADHPIGVPYRGAQKNPQVQTQPNPGNKDAGPYRQAQHLKALEDFRNVSQATVENRTVWWVSESGITARRTRNDLPLYSRTDPESGTTNVPHIECSSCHDPHTANTQLFLRQPSEGSKLCLTCHSK